MPAEGPLVDHGAAEVGEVGDVAVADGPGDVGEMLTHAGRPQRFRQVRPGCRGALLTLVLERAADQPDDHGVRLGRRVRDDEVLAAGLADQPRVAAVAVQLLRHGAPQALERPGGAREVHAAEVGVGQRHLADGGTVAGHHVDHAGRQAGRLEHPHQVVRRELLGRRRLPHDGVAHQRRRRREVAGDGREVERGDRQHEAVQRPVVEAVPHAGRGHRLLGKDLPETLDLGCDGGLELVVDAVADAELGALGEFRGQRDAGMRGERLRREPAQQ